MFQDRDSETEVLLGNKQLLGVFFVLAVLFAVFFTAGYMVGRNSGDKKIADVTAVPKSASSDGQIAADSGESHVVAPDPSTSASDQGPNPQTQDPQLTSSKPAVQPAASGRRASSREKTSSAVKRAQAQEPAQVEERDPVPASEAPVPAGHKTYLQVAALSRAEADAVAKVLNKKGFRTHVAPKPGTEWYRVLVGPVRDAGDLNATRDALKSKGFREVFVQHL